MRQYMASIPTSCWTPLASTGEVAIYSRLIIPLCWPALAATGIFTFVAAREDIFWPLIIVGSPQHYSAPLGFALFVVKKNLTQWDVVMAGSVIATIPMVLMFIFFQRRFIQGIAVSGLKG